MLFLFQHTFRCTVSSFCKTICQFVALKTFYPISASSGNGSLLTGVIALKLLISLFMRFGYSSSKMFKSRHFASSGSLKVFQANTIYKFHVTLYNSDSDVPCYCPSGMPAPAHYRKQRWLIWSLKKHLVEINKNADAAGDGKC